MTRLLIALALTAACGSPQAAFVVPPYPMPSLTRQPVRDVATDVAPSPRPSRASRIRRALPMLLLRIRSCESGPNGYATHGRALDADYRLDMEPVSSASGAYQFLDSTWRSVTGLRGRAKDYPVAVQDAAGLKLYLSDGTGPWLESRPCWGHG